MTDYQYAADADRERAKKIFGFYMRQFFRWNKMGVYEDNLVEWDDFIDSIIDAAVHQMKADMSVE